MLEFFSASEMSVPRALLLLLIVAVLLLVLCVWSIKRHRNPYLVVKSDEPLDALLPSVCGLTHGTLCEGNRVDVFENGAFFEMMFDEIAAARRSVHFETFLWKEGALGQRLVEALVARSRAGVQVRVLVDARGGHKMGKSARQQLVDGGCSFQYYHPMKLANIGVFNERDHRKLVVIDGRVALVGGHCIVDSWLGNAEDRNHFRDIGARLRGPVVHAIQSTFSENWVEVTGELLVGDAVFPPLQPEGEVGVHVARVKPEGSAPAVKILHHLMLCLARERIYIQNPYFLPEAEAVKALGQAVARGVDVRVMVPSVDASDMPFVQRAAHRNFEALLESGVRVFEYTRTLLHQKVMTVDGVWCAIGSSNFDDRSFEINDEVTIGLRDATLARHFEAIFERDAQDCVELKLDRWRRRPWRHKVLDHVLYSFNELL
ncbi:phospholipase D-like domain-containing protein [Caldimonas brevitalea]|uniref:Cardiolipin synthetase n=1 Tax=Caldimonas brevitalea TaxID=413882 RepID=A0A0G3BK09_9BURK|nr:phosphatidylserine/phosphatidylglycerophosphate/cardiolipin synthase family protein [Caldimonas brevitalea]AKJ29757.1 cardiolipin synthetase [Caldimonas brevitalea]